MFKKLFKKDNALGDGEVKTILVRLGNLTSENKVAKCEELKTLANSHSDVVVRLAAIDLISDFDGLSMLLGHSCSQTAHYAAARIAQEDSLRAMLVQSPKLLKIPHMQYAMLQYATTVDQAKAHARFDKLNLVKLCLDCISDDVRHWLTSHISDLKQLHALEKSSRGRNKKTNRLAREQIAKLKNARDQLNNRELESEQLHSGALSILDSDIKTQLPFDTRNRLIVYARLKTLRNTNRELQEANQKALEEKSANETDAERLTELQSKLESTDKLLNQAAKKLEEQIAELSRQEQIRKEREAAKAELKHDLATKAETAKRPVHEEDDPAHILRNSMQDQELKNKNARNHLNSPKPDTNAYKNLWSATSASLKLSKRAQIFSKNANNHSTVTNADIINQLDQLNTSMGNFAAYSETTKKALVVQFSRSLDKLDGLLNDGNMNSATGLHADCKIKSRQLPPAAISSLLVQFGNIEKRYNELLDWRTFAATPKQIELCEAVEQLADNVQEPEAQAEHLKSLRKRWQALGRANRALNKRFDNAASRAFAPCQAHFDEENRIRKTNLDKRKMVLEQLNIFVEENNWSSSNETDWKTAEKILRTARSEWNSYVPIDRGKTRTAQKSFDQVCDQLYQKLASEWKKNLDQKQVYVERARALVNEEGSLATIINEAKSLQMSWRDVGITPRGQDQRLWREFRIQSDKIFARRDQEKKQIHEQRTKLNAELLSECENLLSTIEIYEREITENKSTNTNIKSLFSSHRTLTARMPDAPKSLATRMENVGKKLRNIETLLATRRLAQKYDILKAIDTQIIELENRIIAGEINTPEDLHSCWHELADRFQISLSEKDFSELESVGKRRISILLTLCREVDPETRQNQLDKALLIQTEMVVRAEIEAGIRSDESDEKLRMQMQVERLKSGLANRQIQTLNPERLALEWCGTESSGVGRQVLSTRYFAALTVLMLT